jgi:hypothetical protein
MRTRPAVLPNGYSGIAGETYSSLEQQFPRFRVQPLGNPVLPKSWDFNFSRLSLQPRILDVLWSIAAVINLRVKEVDLATQISNLSHVWPFLEPDAAPVFGNKRWQYFGDNVVRFPEVFVRRVCLAEFL